MTKHLIYKSMINFLLLVYMPVKRRMKAKPKKGVKALAQRALRIAKSVRKDREIKYAVSTTSGSVDTTGTTSGLLSIAQGLDINNRIGDKIRVKSVQMRGIIIAGDTTTITTTVVRLILVRRETFQNTGPSLTEVLGSGYVTYSQFNQDPGIRKQFTVLWDRCYALGVSGPNGVCFKMSKRLNYDMLYDGTTGSDDVKGELVLLMVSNKGASLPTVAVTAKVGYIDS